MKLEKEIKQSKFRNEFHKLAVNIFYSYSWLLNLQTNLFKNFNITSNQYNILRILRGQYPNAATVNLLRERMIDKMSDASRLVERLRQKGLVKRGLCKSDRRRVDVIITEKGLNLLKEIDQLNKKYDAFFKNLTESEAETLNKLLDKMRG
ncbi:MAG: MarR family transcriptional regulator [Stygiobacter sp.]|uniref:MarR family transcriptional regulator n=1 Tax=Stygiobacter electus TaxID=3032292 RepID=A0AAE3P3W2_9BACT|nr:MarR family transcriptional regulator [Stygiobacter electus]MDF1612713.1 MarR family transcriptional regulator [Stygiobacter electus]